MKRLIATATAILGLAAGMSADDNGSKVKVLTEAEFKAMVEDFTTEEWKYLGDSPAIVDFYADWCGPCRQMSPVLDKIAAEYAGKVKVYKVNVDNARELSRSYGIRSIPAFLLIPADGEPQMIVGSMPEKEFKGKIDSALFK